MRGRIARACLAALALAQNLTQPYSIAFAHYMTSVVHLLRGDPARALESAEFEPRSVTGAAVLLVRTSVHDLARPGA